MLGACGSSSTDGSVVESFGISVCSLGCNGGSFALNSHPANKDLSFTFNDNVDPNSVNLSSISIVNMATGASPTGSFIVNGNRVIFRPTLVETSSGVQYGFLDGAVYQVRLFDQDSPNVVRAASGRPNESFITGDITITGVTDLVPGAPTLVSINPDDITPPDGRDFEIEMVFDDVMSTLSMANPETGDSLLITVQSFDTSAGAIDIPGSFVAIADRNDLRTTVTFTPDVPWPSSNNGERQLRISLSQQISDLAGNTLSNPGIKTALLPDLPTVAGSQSETFTDTAKLEDNGRTVGLWASSGAPGTLDSGLDATTGLHKGGGSGVLGSYTLPDGLTTLDTDSMVIASELLGENVTVSGGMFPFSELVINQASRLEATGSNPARVIVRGRAYVEGVIDFSGASAQFNPNGKFFAHQEWDNGTSSSHGTFNESSLGKGEAGGLGVEDKALGFAGAAGDLSGGGGGRGGQSWYYDSIRFVFGSGGDVYLNTSKLMWEQKFLGLPGEPDPTRFKRNKNGDEFNGGNGDGVGGVAATGSPLSASANLIIDYELGSGMGSWAWPPHSGNMPLPNFTNGSPVLTHPTAFFGGSATAFGDFSIHRSRGGGGGGYWTNGEVGQYYDANSTNPSGAPLEEPLIDLDGGDNIREFNGDGSGDNYFRWDLAAGNVIPDADGGHYDLPLNIHTADPEAGLLLGGSGGGGAGMSIHGSIFDRYNGTPGEIGTYRNCPGAGGGAGGGAAQIHVGSRLTIDGSILAEGGDGGDSNFMLTVPFSDTNAI
ncbi:MAG: Ig-like domain-containing protein, partial [Planctomycetota bacterium]|nr:Ig-like domain-containing protein [Planctomycetota bacterium]